MDASRNADRRPTSEEPRTEEIDEKYSEVDPEDVAENAIDYFEGKPETEREKESRR